MTDMSMSADMPCCPDEQKSKDCQDCPLVAMCILKTAQAGPVATAALPLRHAIRTTHLVATTCLSTDSTVRLPTTPLEAWPDRRLGADCFRAPRACG